MEASRAANLPSDETELSEPNAHEAKDLGSGLVSTDNGLVQEQDSLKELVPTSIADGENVALSIDGTEDTVDIQVTDNVRRSCFSHCVALKQAV